MKSAKNDFCASTKSSNSCPKMFIPAKEKPRIITMRMTVKDERSPMPRSMEERRMRRLRCSSK